nr:MULTISPECIES: mandelate racemase/muconate lactonizing enzyme family protein [unclassified Rathayibacter]
MESVPVPTIARLDARLRSVPLRRPWGEDVTETHVVETTITASDGSTGTGFSWTPTIGPRALLALIEDDVRSFVLDRPVSVAPMWDALWARLHEAGSGGLTTIAMAGVDLALWDREARAAGLPMVEHLGRRRDSVAAYGSGVNLHYTLEELVAQVRRWVASGFGAVKVKVGKPDVQEDVDRLAAVREVLGPSRRLMIDANQRWDLPTARRAVAALAPFGLDWIEEPLRADDTWAYAQLRASIDVPVALGENAHTLYRFRDLIEAGACDIVQPNIVRVGGITPFLRIAELARVHGVAIAPHLLPELSGQLALTLPAECWVEDVEDASFESLGLLRRPTGVTVAGGRLTARTASGLGFAFA